MQQQASTLRFVQVALVIRDIQQYQLTPFNFGEEKTISNYVLNLEGLSDKALYKYSLICEPRGGRDAPGSKTLLSNKSLLKRFKFEV